jgi:tetratricopeptide (TPR) repeat protein
VTVEALARAGAQGTSFARCRGLFNAGWLAYFLGRYQEAQGYLEESLTIARAIGDKGRAAAALQPLGMALLGRGDVAKARGYLEEALASARELSDKRQVAAALNALAQLHRLEGELDNAEPLYEQVVVLARELGDRESVSIGLLNLAMVSIGRGSGDRARGMLIEVLAIADEIGSKPAEQSVLEVSAGLAASRTQWKRAVVFFGTAEAQAERTGLRREPTDEAFLAPLIAKAREALGRAAFAEAEAVGRERGFDDTLVEARAWLENRC